MVALYHNKAIYSNKVILNILYIIQKNTKKKPNICLQWTVQCVIISAVNSEKKKKELI